LGEKAKAMIKKALRPNYVTLWKEFAELVATFESNPEMLKEKE